MDFLCLCLIGHSDNLGSGFTTVSKKPLYVLYINKCWISHNNTLYFMSFSTPLNDFGPQCSVIAHKSFAQFESCI